VRFIQIEAAIRIPVIVVITSHCVTCHLGCIWIMCILYRSSRSHHVFSLHCDYQYCKVFNNKGKYSYSCWHQPKMKIHWVIAIYICRFLIICITIFRTQYAVSWSIQSLFRTIAKSNWIFHNLNPEMNNNLYYSPQDLEYIQFCTHTHHELTCECTRCHLSTPMPGKQIIG